MNKNYKVQAKDAKLIKLPKDGNGGSTIKSFDLKDNDILSVSHGKLNNTICTVVSFNNINFCDEDKLVFEGHVNFTKVSEVLTTIAILKPKVLERIIKLIAENNFDEGVKVGKRKKQKEIQKVLGF